MFRSSMPRAYEYQDDDGALQNQEPGEDQALNVFDSSGVPILEGDRVEVVCDFPPFDIRCGDIVSVTDAGVDVGHSEIEVRSHGRYFLRIPASHVKLI